MNLLKKFIGARAEAWTGAGQKNKEPEQVKKYLKFFLKTGRLGNSGYTLKRLFIVQHLKANSGPLWCGSWSLVPQEIKKEEEQDPDPHQYNAYQQHLNYTLPYYRVWEEAGRAGVGVVRVVAGVEAEDSELPFAPSTGIGFKQEIK